MELNLEEALEAPVAVSYRVEVPMGRLERPELLVLEPVAFAGTLQKADPGTCLPHRDLLRGGRDRLFPLPRAGRFLLQRRGLVALRPVYCRPLEDETELTAGDLDVVWYDEFVVPFDPLVEEQLLLELPMKPLCRPDCLGLCPRCGADPDLARVTAGKRRRQAREAEVAPGLKPRRRRRQEALPRNRRPREVNCHAESETPPQQDAPRPAEGSRLPPGSRPVEVHELRSDEDSSPEVRPDCGHYRGLKSHCRRPEELIATSRSHPE